MISSAERPRFPLLQLMLWNATLLSAGYLLFGLVVETLISVLPEVRWLEKVSLVLDSLPARTLHLLGLLGPVTQAHYHNELSGFWLRALFGVTTVGIIFALAMVVGAVMAALGWLLRRRALRQ